MRDLTMAWVLLAVLVAIFLLPRLARRRRELFTVSPSEPISTMHLEMSRKRTEDTRSALEAANKMLK